MNCVNLLPVPHIYDFKRTLNTTTVILHSDSPGVPPGQPGRSY